MKKLWLFLLLLVPCSAEAGIIVMKNGNVFQGRIRAGELSDEFVTMRWPYKDFKGPEQGIERGYVKFERNRIRWFSVRADELTEEYFKKFSDEPIDARFQAAVDQWKEQQEGREKFKIENIGPLVPIRKGPGFAPVPIVKVHYEIRKPLNWAHKDKSVSKREKSDSVLTIVAPEVKKGFAARIHVASVPRPKVLMSKLLRWYEEEIRKLGPNASVTLRNEAQEKLLGTSKKDITMTTTTQIDGLSVVALRFIRIRSERVYFITFYAQKSEFPRLQGMFKNCLKTMVIYEDERAD